MAQGKDGWLPRYSGGLRPPFHQLTRSPAVPDIPQSSFEPRDRIRVQRGTSRNQYTPASLTELSHFEGLTGDKPFRISEGYPRVFTTGKGAAAYFGGIWEALIRGGG